MADEFDQYKRPADEFEKYKRPQTARLTAPLAQRQADAEQAKSQDAAVREWQASHGTLRRMGETALGMGKAVAHDVGAAVPGALGMRFRSAMQPTNPSQEAGYTAAQIMEFFAPVPGGAKLKAMKGLGGAAARTGVESLKSGVLTGAQTGSIRGGATGAALGAVGSAVSEGAAALKPKVAKAMYESAVKPAKGISLEERELMTARGLQTAGKELPVMRSSLPKLSDEEGVFKRKVNSITVDPRSPFSGATVPIDDVLRGTDQYIATLRKVDESAADSVQRARDTWAKSLGYKPPTPAASVSTGLFDPSGKPIMRTVPAKPGNVYARVRDIQRLKDDITGVINSSAYKEGAEPAASVEGRKIAHSDMKKAIEDATTPAVKQLNRQIQTDIELKDSILNAIKSHPSWVNDWAVYALGSAAGGVFVSGHRTMGESMAIGAIARMALRNPAIMSRTAIMLQRAGTLSPQLLPALGPLVRPTPRQQFTPPAGASVTR